MKYLASSDVAAIIAPTGLREKQFQGWVNQRFIRPAEGGGAQGRTRLFTIMQVVGIGVMARLFMSERGCDSSYIETVVDAFSKLDEGWLLKEFKAGRTELAAVHQGRPILDGKRPYDTVSVKDAYEAVMEYVQKVGAKN